MPIKELRSLEFRDGTSDKFWTIALDGPSHSVRFGRRGTQGQEQSKTFSSEDAARTSYDKLVAEKLKKGYSETGGEPAPVPAAKKTIRTETVKEVRKNLNPAGLHLDPEDWLFATWRPREIRPRPQAPAFSLESGLQRLERFLSKVRHNRPWNEAKMPTATTAEEARFWLGVMIAVAELKRTHQWATHISDPKGLLRQAAGIDLGRTPPITELIERLNAPQSAGLDLTAAVFLPLSALYSWDDILLFIDGVTSSGVRHIGDHDDVFRLQVLPFLQDSEVAALRTAVGRKLQPAIHGDFRESIAPLLGLHQEIADFVQRSPIRTSGWIFGLGSAQEVRSRVKNGNFHFQPKTVRAWLAHTELEDLGTLTEAALRMGKTDGRPVVSAFAALVSAPVAAPEFLRLTEDGKFALEARKWFDDHPREALEGLAAEAAGSSKKAALARSIIQSLKRKLGEAVEEEAPSLAPSVGELPDGLAQCFATARRTKVKEPKWVAAADLPPIVVDNGRLGEKDVKLLLGVMATSAPMPPHPLLVALRCYATPESLDTFAEALFTAWRDTGLSGKEKWALFALGALGSDRCALRIAPYVREWPGQSKHQAATWGLECLRLIGTDTAIMQINQIAQKTKFQALKKSAQETMESISEDRGLTRDELEDRIVPDCGLDEQGSRVFDFGPRQFKLRIAANLKPVVLDNDGTRRDDLPKPTSKDDAAKAQAAVSEWKLIKKQMSEVVKAQVARMEQALVTQRRWTVDDFRNLLVQHPILGALIRPLVWGVFDRSNQLIASFRVAEDLTYADSGDDAFEPEGEVAIGVVHPAHLDEISKAKWGEVLADYELIQPFPQLTRRMHRLTAEELAGNEIARHTEAKMKPIVFAGIAKRLGYVHGQIGDGGSYNTHAKWFSAAGITVVLQHTFASIGYFETEPVSLEKAYFVPEKFGRGGWAEEARKKVPLCKVDEMVISEVLSDMGVLASRAEEQ